MWRIYLIEFIIVVIIAVIWVNLLDKSKSKTDGHEWP
jgi:hypothetical protein